MGAQVAPETLFKSRRNGRSSASGIRSYAHLELQAELHIGGQTEAAFERNDVLDVPLVPRPVFSLRVVDDLGEPLPEVALRFNVSGHIREVTTDADGIARVDDLGASSAFVEFVQPGAIRDDLGRRYQRARSGTPVHPTPGVALLPIAGLNQPLILSSAPSPHHTVSIQPRVVEARLTGILFDTNKSFLLPSGIPSLRRLKALYEANPRSHLLLVGHTDRRGSSANNDQLSLQRADSVAAFLKDDVDAWLAQYDSTVSESSRWGSHEDLLMLTALALGTDSTAGTLDASLVAAFQRLHNRLPSSCHSKVWLELPNDGQFDAETRRQLIADYMNQDGTTLPEDVTITTHGCGEHFPLDDSGQALDATPQDGRSDPLDRRVELFFFEEELGIQPAPAGKNSKKGSPQYPEWRRLARETHELESRAHGPLKVATFAPQSSDVKLFVLNERGAPVAELRREHGRQDQESLTFSFVPEVMPSPVEFRVLRDTRLEHESGLIDPVALRDALFAGDLETASDHLGGKSADGTTKSTPEPLVRASFAKQGPGTKAPELHTMQLRIVIEWEHPNHRFLKTMCLSVNALGTGAVLNAAAGSRPGRMVFDLDNSVDRIGLELNIQSPVAKKPILDVSQEFKVMRHPGYKPTLMPEKPNRGSFQHPRIKTMEYGQDQPGTTVLVVKLDLLFLDVTEHVLALPATGSVSTTERFSAVLANKVVLGIRSDIFIIEYTGGQPVTWAIIVPPTLDHQALEMNLLLFLRHELLERSDTQGALIPGDYSDSDDAPYRRLLGHYFPGIAPPGRYVFTSGSRLNRYHNYPVFGWDRQLVESGKKVLLLFPVPHGAAFGVLDRPEQSSKALLESALVCLFAERRVGATQSRAPGIRRLAVGGWSSGTDTLFKWAKPVPALGFVDELYVFDGKRGFPVDLKAWFMMDPGRRRLRLIGTAYTETASNHIKLTLIHQHVFVYPGDPKYWYQNADYHSSLQRALDPAPLRFRRSVNAARLPADASFESNIYLEAETLSNNGTTVSQSITLFSPKLGRRKIGSLGHEEAAAILVCDLLRPEHKHTRTGSVATSKEFDSVMEALNEQSEEGERKRSFRHRHPWSVFGGLFNHKGRAFVGYFQLCLEESGF